MTVLANMVEVELKTDEDFLKVRETLSRIGVASKKKKQLFQSCHILHKQGRYYIVHFKELFALDGKPSSMSDDDTARRNTIANLLEEWELVKLVNPEQTKDLKAPLSQIKIITHKDKDQWELVTKYSIGRRFA